MLSEIGGFDDNDSFSISDDSFMPPVLSSYANELLGEEKENSCNLDGISMKFQAAENLKMANSGAFETERTDDNTNRQSVVKSREISTPGATSNVFGGRQASNTTKSLRTRRLGRALNDLKKSYEAEKHTSSASETSNKSSEFGSSSPSQLRPAKIRFADESEGISLSTSNIKSPSFQDESSKETTPELNSSSLKNTSGPFASRKFSQSSKTTSTPILQFPTKFSKSSVRSTPPRKDTRDALRPLSPNIRLTDSFSNPKKLVFSADIKLADPIISSQSTVIAPATESKPGYLHNNLQAAKIKQQYQNSENQPEVQSAAFQGFSQPQQSQSNVPEKPRKKAKNLFTINNQQYQRLELVGKGGSSKVYKVQTMAQPTRTYAVKKVTFDDVDISVIQGFKGEINLLQQLRNESRVVKLIDFEVFDTSVYVVMECGEIDLAHMLNARLSMPLDIGFVRYYSQEILKCVAAVHKHGIVHSDLKPANFLMVQGVLKIIDFGIANVVPEYTVNVRRDLQIGTPNYMAPEALLESTSVDGDGSTFKVGKPSDVWSCGCIIYQMIYGKAPYASYSGAQRVLAITNPKVAVQYPKEGLGGVKVPRTAIQTIKGCLLRDPNQRWSVEKALEESFLNPLAIDKDLLKTLFENAIRYGSDRRQVTAPEMDQLTSDIWSKLSALNNIN